MGFFGFGKPQAPALAPAEAVQRAKAGELVLVDVRDISELQATGKARGAVHIPLMLLQTRADPRSPECDPALKAGKPLGVYCASGGRSQMAAEMLMKMGHEEVHNIGGIGDWANAGGVIEAV